MRNLYIRITTKVAAEITTAVGDDTGGFTFKTEYVGPFTSSIHPVPESIPWENLRAFKTCELFRSKLPGKWPACKWKIDNEHLTEKDRQTIIIVEQDNIIQKWLNILHRDVVFKAKKYCAKKNALSRATYRVFDRSIVSVEWRDQDGKPYDITSLERGMVEGAIE